MIERFGAVALSLTIVGLFGCERASTGVGDGGLPIGDGLFQACAISSAKATLKRVALVVMLDRSGSMGDGINGDPTVKWRPVGAAMKSFFADPNSAGLSASLQYFPLDDQCNSSAYYFPAVTMRTLPNSTDFIASIDAQTPAGETPTLPAIIGAIDYAKDYAASDPGARTAILLVTDGEPSACESSVRNVSTEVERVAASIPTYVIGVGDSVNSLAMIASSGGTGQPTFVSTNSPSQTTADFQRALETIRGMTLSCSFTIPQPTGTAIDYSNVNVVFKPGGGGAVSALPYSTDCGAGGSWRYDNRNAPTRIELCPTICQAVRSDRAGEIEMVFGCATLVQ